MTLRSAGTCACRADTSVGAGARPGIILRSRHQSRLNRIVLDIPDNPTHLNVIADPVIVRFPVPEGFPGSPKNFIGFTGSESFQSSKQAWRRNLRQEQYVDMIGHQNPSPQFIVAKFSTAMQGGDYQLRDRFEPQVQRAFLRGIEIAVHPNECLAGGELARRRVSPLGNAAMQMPRSEDPFSFRVKMGQAAHRPLVSFVDCNSHPILQRRHECRRGRHECPRHQ
jgi:hypothetical protein